jgi:hypothetical protein
MEDETVDKADHPRGDDRNDEVEGSPVPDPTEDTDAGDIPEAD